LINPKRNVPPVLKKEVTCKIKENSLIARIAAAKLRSARVAIVIGKTIHLHNTTASDFLGNERWVRHELAHVRQFDEHGFFPFLLKYLVESIRRGYYHNRYEAEAREAEKDARMREGITFN
jgi:hypothetical protein